MIFYVDIFFLFFVIMQVTINLYRRLGDFCRIISNIYTIIPRIVLLNLFQHLSNQIVMAE